jgi:hypothetical protein
MAPAHDLEATKADLVTALTSSGTVSPPRLITKRAKRPSRIKDGTRKLSQPEIDHKSTKQAPGQVRGEAPHDRNFDVEVAGKNTFAERRCNSPRTQPTRQEFLRGRNRYFCLRGPRWLWEGCFGGSIHSEVKC